MRIIASGLVVACLLSWCGSVRRARPTACRTTTRGCRFALLLPAIDGVVADDASSRGVDGTADEASPPRAPILPVLGQAHQSQRANWTPGCVCTLGNPNVLPEVRSIVSFPAHVSRTLHVWEPPTVSWSGQWMAVPPHRGARSRSLALQRHDGRS